jgi:hypothetical protein
MPIMLYMSYVLLINDVYYCIVYNGKIKFYNVKKNEVPILHECLQSAL